MLRPLGRPLATRCPLACYFTEMENNDTIDYGNWSNTYLALFDFEPGFQIWAESDEGKQMVDVLKGNHRNKYPQKPELTVEKIGKQLRHSYKVKMASRAKGTNIQTEFQKKYQERRAKASIQRTCLKGAAEEFQDLCKRAQHLSNKGLLECLIIATLKKSPDEELMTNEEAVVDEGHDQWETPTIFSTPSLTKLVPFMKSSNYLNQRIPELASAGGTGVSNEMARIIDYPTKTPLPEASNILESKNNIKIMRADLEKIRNYLKKSIGWSQWQGNSIINHKIVDGNYFYFVEGVDKRFWDLTPKSDMDLITVWFNIGMTSITKMGRDQLEKCLNQSPQWEPPTFASLSQIQINNVLTHDTDLNIGNEANALTFSEGIRIDREGNVDAINFVDGIRIEGVTDISLSEEEMESLDNRSNESEKEMESLDNRLNESEEDISIFDLEIKSKHLTKELTKKVCFFGNCNQVGQRWECDCCNMSFCTNHSRPANHLHSPQCSLCINNEDECPALYSHEEKEMCFNCIYGRYLKFKKSSHLSKIHLEFVDCLALKKCAKNLEHFTGLFISRYINVQISEKEFLSLKCRYLVVIFAYHCEALSEDTSSLDLLRILMLGGNMVFNEVKDMDAINLCMMNLRSNQLYTTATRRRKRRRVIMSSQL